MKIKEQAQLVIQDAHDIHLKIVKEIFTMEEQWKNRINFLLNIWHI